MTTSNPASDDQSTLATTRVGTSGYSFDDWRGRFYPDSVGKGKMLDYYVRHFSTVEINSTYYGIPRPSVMEKIARKAPPGFDFTVKVPQVMTHGRQDFEKDLNAFEQAMLPLSERGLLSGLLAQFPYSFKYSQDSLDYVCVCADALRPHRLFVEFRHDSWVNRTMYERLRAHEIGYVAVDEPSLPHLLNPDCFATTDVGYVRLHGRNAEQWWHGGALRYDYRYSATELADWKVKIDKLRRKVSTVYVFFNNCHLGQAASNATEFAAMLDENQA
jgi:uncharacterized protein YecE (DUF72 family)